MATAPAAIPVNPNTAEIIAIIKKITAQRNISVYLNCEFITVKHPKKSALQFTLWLILIYFQFRK